MLNFINPNLALWGSLLVALPVLIHLINLLRHRRVPWAAMEFLLESQRRNSTWIKLKQLLLLLLRMAAVAGVVLLVAQPIGCNELGRLLANTPQCQECIVKQVFRYFSGRLDTAGDQPMIRRALEVFQKSGFHYKDMVVSLLEQWNFPPAERMANAATRQ